MSNEIVFLAHALLMGFFALGSLLLGKEALISFICVQCILANLFVVKQTTLMCMTATCSDAFSIGAVLGLNLLQEYYGRATARRAIWISFFLLIFYTAASYIHCLYAPALTDTMHAHFALILGCMPRIVVASVLVYLTVQHIDSWLYGKLRSWLTGRYLVFRTATSIAICQLLDTVLFSFLGLYGIVDNLLQIIIVSYSIKVAAILCSLPFVALSKRLINQERNLER